ncbi:MAG: radical SAM protein [Candidatus Staskawiczbacteria bacterium]|nr:radical SAM protein [Candidatus Staskawiczbacteria bacterium]
MSEANDPKILNSERMSEQLRVKSIDFKLKTIRMAKLTGSLQESDLSSPLNCGGFGRVHHFRMGNDPKWIKDPLPTVPVCKYFDVPTSDVMLAQVFQLAACDFRCWYCFVDYSMLSADSVRSEFVSPKNLLEMMTRENVGSKIIDLSGGQPDIVPEYVLWFIEARAELGMEKSHFVWVDDNLSTDFLWKHLSEEQLSFLVNAPGFARVGCIKGFDAESFAFNTRADESLFDRQIDILSRLVKTGFDQYGYITLTATNINAAQEKISRLLDEIQNKIHPNFPLRIVPLRIFQFGANAERYNKQAEENQFRVLDAWMSEMQKRFVSSQLSTPITEVEIRS